jgi:hypothetical protein
MSSVTTRSVLLGALLSSKVGSCPLPVLLCVFFGVKTHLVAFLHGVCAYEFVPKHFTVLDVFFGCLEHQVNSVSQSSLLGQVWVLNLPPV